MGMNEPKDIPVQNIRSGYRALYLVVAVTVISFLIIATPFGRNFLNDDFIHIPAATEGKFLQTSFLRPVADLTLWFDGVIWGKNPLGFHITNILIHLISTLLLFNLIKKFSQKYARAFAFEKALFTASLFLVYAFHSESLFWVIGRGGSLAALFISVSIYCYTASQSWRSMSIAILSFSLGLFTYEFVWVLPLLIFLFQLFDSFQKRKPEWRWTISFALLFAIYIFYRVFISELLLADYESGLILSADLERLAYNFTATLARSFIPPMISSTLFVVCFVILILIITAVIFRMIKTRRNELPFLILPLACLIVSCTPSVSRGIDIHDSEGERFLYTASLFCCWIIVEVVFWLVRSLRIKMLVILILLIFHGYYLNRSSTAYRYAGKVVRLSIEALELCEPAQILSAIDVPTQYKGALIFRKGFGEAVNWMLPGKFDEIKIVTSKGIRNKENVWSVIKKDPGENAQNIRTISWTEGTIVVQ